MRVEDIVFLLAIRKNDGANIQMERNGAMRDSAMEPAWKFRVNQISGQIALFPLLVKYPTNFYARASDAKCFRRRLNRSVADFV
jgi:hypothetical protein